MSVAAIALNRTDEAKANWVGAEDLNFPVSLTSRGVGGGQVLAQRHGVASAELSRRAVVATDRLASWQAWGSGVPTVAVAVGLLVGMLAVLDGELTVGGLLAFSTWMGTIAVAVEVGLIRAAQTLEARVAADRLLTVLGTAGWRTRPMPVRRREPVVAEVVVPGSGRLTARPGGIFAITGPTGCGKSRLLARLAADHPGATLVPQRPLVLAGTVRDNLTLGEDVPEQDLLARLRDVGLAEEVGLEDQLVTGTDELSGGQIQRLAVARALTGSSPVLLLDDVTSAIDEATEAVVLSTLIREAAARIVIVVSHRPAVLAAAEQVLDLERA